MAKTGNNAATKALQQELKSLQKEPLEGFTVQLINDNLFEWEVAIFGKKIFFLTFNNRFFLNKILSLKKLSPILWRFCFPL